MFGFNYLRVGPNFFVVQYVNGKIRRQGRGLAFLYFQPTSSIVLVPVASVDVPFIFDELTADYQEVTLQGQITYRVSDPLLLAQNLNYTIHGDGRYLRDDPQKLDQRIVNFVRVLARPHVQALPLKQALQSAQAISAGVMETIRSADAFHKLGVEVVAFSLLAVRATPEMAKAIEAEAREELKKSADEAISERRNAAVEQDRHIKENELLTKQLVEEKEQQLKRTRLQSEIDLENQRELLVSAQAKNLKEEADARGYSLRSSLEPFRLLEPKALQTIMASRTDPKVVVAMALQDLAADASRIGHLNITPDLLTSLIEGHDASRESK